MAEQEKVETQEEVSQETDVEQIEEAAGAEEAEAAGGEEGADDELAKLRAEAEEYRDRHLRAAAELDNLRKRTARIRLETREEGLRDMLLQFAPVLDNLQRALSLESEDLSAFRQGVELIQQQFQEVLGRFGLEEIKSVGQPFDPNLHEALMQMESDEFPAGTVLEETEKGYRLGDKVLRPARVVVSRASDENK